MSTVISWRNDHVVLPNGPLTVVVSNYTGCRVSLSSMFVGPTIQRVRATKRGYMWALSAAMAEEIHDLHDRLNLIKVRADANTVVAPTCSGGLYPKKQEHCVYQRVSSLCNCSMLFIGSLFFHAFSWVTASWHGEFSQVQIAELYGLNKKFRWELQGSRCR